MEEDGLACQTESDSTSPSEEQSSSSSSEDRREKKILDIYMNVEPEDITRENLNVRGVEFSWLSGDGRVLDTKKPEKKEEQEDLVVARYTYQAQGDMEDLIVNVVNGDVYEAARCAVRQRLIQRTVSNYKMYVIQSKDGKGSRSNVAENEPDKKRTRSGRVITTPVYRKGQEYSPGKEKLTRGQRGKRVKRKDMIDSDGKNEELGNKNKIECDICSKSYVHLSNLSRHIAIVHKHQRHVCKKCGMVFTRTDSLLGHTRENKCPKRHKRTSSSSEKCSSSS